MESEHKPESARQRRKRIGARWTDRWVGLWYRLTYCTRHGHHPTAFGGPEEQCLTCGARVVYRPVEGAES